MMKGSADIVAFTRILDCKIGGFRRLGLGTKPNKYAWPWLFLTGAPREKSQSVAVALISSINYCARKKYPRKFEIIPV